MQNYRQNLCSVSPEVEVGGSTRRSDRPRRPLGLQKTITRTNTLQTSAGDMPDRCFLERIRMLDTWKVKVRWSFQYPLRPQATHLGRTREHPADIGREEGPRQFHVKGEQHQDQRHQGGGEKNLVEPALQSLGAMTRRFQSSQPSCCHRPPRRRPLSPRRRSPMNLLSSNGGDPFLLSPEPLPTRPILLLLPPIRLNHHLLVVGLAGILREGRPGPRRPGE